MVASIMDMLGRANIRGHSKAKGGLHGLVCSMAVEPPPHRITVNALATEGSDVRYRDSQFNARIKSRAARAHWRDPAERAAPAVCFASDASSYMTGQVLAIDGGLIVAL